MSKRVIEITRMEIDGVAMAIAEVTLTDGSKVYYIIIGTHVFPVASRIETAEAIFELLRRALGE